MGLSKITGIKLKGANFETETSLQLIVANKEPALGMVYGKNGAGKSTISRAFSKVSGKVEETIENASVIDFQGNEVILTEEEKIRIHVFNEQYVDSNIKFRPDGKGLETIVVLGKANDIEKKMNDAQKAVDEQIPKVKAQEEFCAIFEDDKSDKSALFYMKKVKDALKGENAWGGRDAKIKGNIRATATREDTYTQFVSRKPLKKRDELLIEFESKLKELNEAKSGIKKVDKAISVERLRKNKFDEQKFIELLNKKIEKPELNEREQFLLTLQSTLGQEHPQKIKVYFEKIENARCPFCLQTVTEQYKKELFSSIERALSKAAEKHVEELNKIFLEQEEFDYEPYRELNSTALRESEECLSKLNLCIDDINNSVKRKKDDIYSPLNVTSCTINKAYDEYITSLTRLEEERLEYNKKASETDSKIVVLNDINADIAYYDIIDAYKESIKCLSEEKKAREKLRDLKEELEKRDLVLQGYKEQKRDAKIALKQINNDLSYIFFAKDRLSIEMDGEQYLLKSRKKAVSPNKISVGERNAIALCYFFSEIMREQKEEDVYTNQYYFIIDDPVSSFDMENRIGIMSFLKHQLNKFISGNMKTKVVLFTHDLQTACDIEKIYGEITDLFGIVQRERKNHIKIQELLNNDVRKFEISKRNEYTQLMINIYKYVKGVNAEYELVVGNSMRRVMEAYGTFMYKKGIEKLSTAPEIKAILPVPFSEHFENLMYRLVLHGGSHSEERIHSMISEDFFDYISSEEKKRTAKEILVFLYLMDKQHVLEHLKKDTDGANLPDVSTDLESWKNEIQLLISVNV